MEEKHNYEELLLKIQKLEKDVFEGKQAGQELLKSEKKLRSLVETTTDLVWEIDLNGVYTYAGPSVKGLLGYDVDEFIGTTIFDSVVDEEKERTNEFFNEGCKMPEPFSGWRVTLFHKHGKRLTVDINGTPLIDEYGRLVGWCGFDKDITDKVMAEEALQKTNAELNKTNELLSIEIEERKQMELALRERENDLKRKANDLQEANTALKVLLKHREEDKAELQEKVYANVKKIVEPYLEELRTSGLSSTQKIYLDILKSNLQEIISPFARKLSSEHAKLTPTEIKVANLVRLGKTTKEISSLMKISGKTVERHRDSIRHKLGIKKKKVNLNSYLLSFE
jgi:PAS domain S-box-containing protein